jgi:hypothetical protein
MISHRQDRGRLSLKAVALLGIWSYSGSTALAGGGADPGFQGFGLGYRLGYGYGGAGVGVGPDGGYPCYGGPGYPHPWPRLRRIGGITPFPYFGGPGYPTPDCPNYFGGVGPLAIDPPVIVVEAGPGEADYGSGYGVFTGAHPNAEALFAPFTNTAASGGPYSEIIAPPPPTPPTNTPPTPGDTTRLPATGRTLGVDAEPVNDPGGVRGLRVTKVYPGSAADRVGLHAGDVIQSINGYLTQKPGNLTWIISKAAPDNVLKLSVRTASPREVRTLTTRLP